MKYVYKNEADRPINIGGYQFALGAEISSNIIIERFKEAVSNGFLSLREVRAAEALKVQVNDPEEEAKKAAEAEAVRQAEEIQKAEEAKKAEAAQKDEDTRLAEEAQKIEDAKKIEEVQKDKEDHLSAEEEAAKAVEEEASKNNK